MKIISFIDEPLLIHRILEYLGLWHESLPKGLPPPKEQEDTAEVVVCEAFATAGAVTMKRITHCTDGHVGCACYLTQQAV